MKGSYTDNRPDPIFYGSFPEMPVIPLDLPAAIVLIQGQLQQIASLQEREKVLIGRLHTHGDIETDKEDALRGEEVKNN